LLNNVIDRGTAQLVAGPTIAFIDTEPEMLGALALNPSNLGSQQASFDHHQCCCKLNGVELARPSPSSRAYPLPRPRPRRLHPISLDLDVNFGDLNLVIGRSRHRHGEQRYDRATLSP
jgi:hypothetical protein